MWYKVSFLFFCYYTILFLNRLPTKALETRTPYEAWFENTPHFEYLRVYDCTVHVKTAKQYMKKFDD